MKIVSRGELETKKLAAKLAGEILKSRPHQKHARVVGLVGDLGAGKTTFTQGFAKKLGVKERTPSPTFLIFRSYKIKNRNHTTLYHADAYRIRDTKDLTTLGFREILADPKNVVLVEWADQIKKILPKDTIWVELRHGRNETERFITY